MASDKPDRGSASWQVRLPTPEATRAFGAALGAALLPGDIVGLDGPLGAGKTCLVQGLARGLGVPEQTRISSPTFTLVNEYRGEDGRPLLYHVDLYRLHDEAELYELGLWEASNAGAVMALEWLGRFPAALPADRLQIDLSIEPVIELVLDSALVPATAAGDPGQGQARPGGDRQAAGEPGPAGDPEAADSVGLADAAPRLLRLRAGGPVAADRLAAFIATFGAARDRATSSS